ncbi:hypothetical protein QOZ80_9BG0699260 [Eleusine coracana subsp. coracana]|nr:hypothetical protein QOZ80_9BG0699260 [Eleusine coracana subsp. coracana]
MLLNISHFAHRHFSSKFGRTKRPPSERDLTLVLTPARAFACTGCRIIMDIVIGAARWVVGTALSRVTDGLLESWVASSGLGPNVRALKLELLYAQGILNNARGRDVHNPALGQLLLELRHQAYNADDVLDELEYFRIQDELDGTYETVDDDRGLVNGLVLNFHHTARAVARDQSETLQIVTSLRELRIKRCDRLQLVALGLSGLSNLRKLEIAYDSLYLPKGHLPSSLTELIICYCPAIRSLPKGTLPNSLKILEIRGCSAFRSLPRDSLPSSLTELTIYNCPAIRSLHKESLTSSIQTLDVRFSRNEKLRMQCRKLKGTIPIVMVDL